MKVLATLAQSVDINRYLNIQCRKKERNVNMKKCNTLETLLEKLLHKLIHSRGYFILCSLAKR